MSSAGDDNVPLDLQDEITSLNSIYADGTFELLSSGGDQKNQKKKTITCRLSPPAAVINPPVILKITFDSDYPNTCPEIIEGTTGGKGLSREEVAQVAKDILAQIWVPGGVITFELVEALKEVLHREPELELEQDQQQQQQRQRVPDTDTERESDKDPSRSSDGNHNNNNTIDIVSQIPWATTPPTTVQKSVFIGRAVKVTSVDQTKAYVEELLATDRKVAKATHNITAWRIKTEDGVQFQDNDDDGETAAGSRLAHLLELIGVWNVMVVVSRWYGDVKLGPDRFRIINQVAREALDIGNLIISDGGSSRQAKGSTGGGGGGAKEKGKVSKGK